jgi:hypothetical protein
VDVNDLNEPERALWKAFPRGEAVALDIDTGADPGSDADSDSRSGSGSGSGAAEDGDPASCAAWESERTVRAEVIAALLLGAVPPEPGHTAAVRLSGARITGRLGLAYAEIPWPVRLRSCSFAGPIDMYGARVRQINLEGSRLAGLDASLATIDGNLRLLRSRCAGQIKLAGARITGALLLQESRLVCQDHTVLLANRLIVDDDLLFQDAVAIGEVRLAGARVGGMVGLNGTTLENPGGRALNAFNLNVGAHLWARHGFTATGEVALGDAVIGRDLDLSGARLRNPGRDVLFAQGLRVGTVLGLGSGFTAEGAVRLTRATVGGSLDLAGARLANPAGLALTCHRAQAGELVLRPAEPVDGAVDLSHARFDVIRDDPATWPGDLRLDGLNYQSLDPQLPARRRLAWLRRDHSGFLPQNYEQLATAYQRLGDEAGTRTVLLAKQRRRSRNLGWYARIWGRLQDLTVGYGYRPLRAAGCLVVLLLLGTAVFGGHRPVPVTTDGRPPAFNALVYTLDLLLPIVDLGQERAYDPGGEERWLAYALIAAGWLLATTVAAGITRALRRDAAR